MNPVNPKGTQPWIFLKRTDAKAETPIHWPPDVTSWLTGQEEKGTIEDEMVE